MACVRGTPGESRNPGSGPVPRTLRQGAAKPKWLKSRRYRHFDLHVGEAFVPKVMDSRFVAGHRFSPLLHYTKVEKRYKKDPVTTHRAMTSKERPIKYASHRDACILAYYAHLLNEALDARYAVDGTGENAIAYRALGRSNGDFAAEAFRFAQANAPVVILAFDVTSFFDTFDHGLLKGAAQVRAGHERAGRGLV